MKLWFGSLSPGIGDYIHAMSIIPEWQKRNIGERVVVATKPYGIDPRVSVMLHWPGVDYIESSDSPDGFYDIWQNLPGSQFVRPINWDRRRRYADFGLPWNWKRMYYPLRPDEREYAETIWGRHVRPRIVLQWDGGMDSKAFPAMEQVYDHLDSMGDVIVLDYKRTAPARIERRIVGMRDVRLVLALPSTADMFVGYDSGPFYAAIGNLVPSVGLFPTEDPDMLFMPIISPDIRLLFARHALHRIPLDDVLSACDQIFETINVK